MVEYEKAGRRSEWHGVMVVTQRGNQLGRGEADRSFFTF